MRPARIVIAEDHVVVRQGLDALLRLDPLRFEVVGEASDGPEALSAVAALSPDVLVADLMLPTMSGLEVIRQARRSCPRLRAVVLSMHAAEAYVAEAFRVGASGYVLKEAGFSEVRRALEIAVAGGRYVSPPLTLEAVDKYSAVTPSTAIDPYDTLTLREREILRLVASGLTSPEMGRRLGISSRTAEAHRANLWRKLGARSQADLIRFALERGLVGPRGR